MRLSKPGIRCKLSGFLFCLYEKKNVVYRKLAYYFAIRSGSVKHKNESEAIAVLKERIKLLERSQNRAENYLENIINIIPANIFWKDTSCVLLGSNLSHTKQAGFSNPKEVIGKTDFDFVWKDAAEELINNDLQVMQSGKGLQFEETGVLADGSSHVFLTNKVPMLDKDNQVIGLIGVSTDITEFKALQTELIKAKDVAAMAISEKAIAESSAFAANARANAEEEMRKTVMVLVGDIVHDLRTPITTIKAAAQLLDAMLPILFNMINESKKVGAFTQNQWDYLLQNKPINSIKNATVMIDEFITATLTQLANAHKAHLTALTKDELIKCSIRRIIHNTLEGYPFTDSEKIKIHQDIACDFYLMGNSILIMKILFNLIKNALEQIAINGDGIITIYTRKGEDYNLVIIKDTGGGASIEVTANMFNDYFTTKKNGTGIGLAFCKRTMMSFGGDIVSHSEYGKSMEFTLKFPIVANN